jgi:hypothetical protein
LVLSLGQAAQPQVVGREGEEQMVGKFEEASMNIDIENLKPFLLRIVSFMEKGFSTDEIDKVMALAHLPHDSDEEIGFSVVFQGQQTPLIIRVFMDDIQNPDIYFFTSPQLAERISKEFEAFCEELGL